MPLIECLEESAEERAVVPSSQARRTAHRIDPLQDRRWDEFVERHPGASLFHSSAWLAALSGTYGYKPVAYTIAARGQRLEGSIVFCQVESWLTGRRLVSLPFSDHCEPLVNNQQDWDAITIAVEKECRRAQWRYIEMRPRQNGWEAFPSLQLTATPYTLHQLDLGPDVETLFHNCHKNSTQRKILRAEREGLRYREGASQELLDCFYRLHANTRKRHRRPPQPRKWFVNLIRCFGDALKIRVALHGERPVAAVITIRHKDTLVYKYGGSDPGFNHLGGMHLLLWRAIKEAKVEGLRCFDFGRTEAGQHGLITFKRRWGSAQSDLVYSRYSLSDNVSHMFEVAATNWKSKAATYLLAHMQPRILAFVGRAFYRHVG
jgi:CelD/BcsL family acetyltransferase involved in cellulose biosynthesis